MKRIIILLTFLLTLWVVSINVEWEKAYFPSKPSAGPVVDIYFTDILNGWAVGFNRWLPAQVTLKWHKCRAGFKLQIPARKFPYFLTIRKCKQANTP